MPGAHIDTAFVDILPDVSRFAAKAEKDLNKSLKGVTRTAEAAALGIEDDFKDAFEGIEKDAIRSFGRAKREISTVADVADKAFQDIERNSRTRLPRVGRSVGEGIAQGAGDALKASAPGLVKSLSGGLSAASGPLLAVAVGLGTQLAGGIAPAFAGLAAALPGIVGVAGASIATLTLGFQGLGDAIDALAEGDAKKIEEAFKSLSPSAILLAKEINSLTPAFNAIRSAAQEGLFGGFQGELTRLVSVLQAPLKNGLNDVGIAIGMVAREFIGFLTSTKGVEVLNEIFKTTAAIFAGLAPAIKPLATGISDLVIAAQPFIQELSRDFAGFLQRIGEGLTRLAESGQLDRFFDQAITSLETLGRIGENLFPIILGLFEALAPAGDDFLVIIEDLTRLLAEFLSNEDAVTALAAAFRAIGFALTINLRLFVIFAEAGRAIGEALAGTKEVTDQLTGAVTSFGQTAQAWFRVALDSVGSVVSAISNAPAALAALGGRFYSAGVSLIRSFFGGLSSAASFAGNLASSVYSALKSGLNSAIGLINNAIGTLDSALPVSFPRIPMLARGGVALGPAVVGEAGPELAVPLAGQRGRQAMQQVAEAAQGATPSISFEPGSVSVTFEGAVPTEAQAFMTGQAVGRGVVAVLERRNIRMQVRRA